MTNSNAAPSGAPAGAAADAPAVPLRDPGMYPWLIAFASRERTGIAPGRASLEMLRRALAAGKPEEQIAALEAIVDKVSPEFHEFAGRAKDMGSAAVFVLMLNVVLCWALVLWPRLS